ncbi:MAG: phosphate acyltransferase PlsX [Myxococcales bacterium]|nr:phosphate acyltransferase PlsX [Myxococcales bacterium]
MRIAVDAMGHDTGPQIPVEAALTAALEGTPVTLVGDEARIRQLLSALGGAAPEERLRIVHAPDVVEMGDKPSRALRKKPEASVRVGARRVAEGLEDAFVSAGNSGAVMGAGLLEVGTLPGVERPALASVFPTRKHPVVVLDLGANVEPTPVQLAQFAVMGAAYAEAVLGRAAPRVAVMANGSEEVKGNHLTRATHMLLKQTRLDYRGYCEGGDVFAGDLDVVVTDGFTGNVVLKTLEGLVKTVRGLVKERLETSLLAGAGALLMKDVFMELKDRFDYEGAGGAPLLGLSRPVVVAHGSSTPYAMQSAIRAAGALVRTGVTEVVARRVLDHAALWG